MTVEEILNIIHNEEAEVEVYKALSDWIIHDRQQQIVKVARYRSTVKVIDKIANGNPNKSEAIEGIKNLCSDK